MPYDPSFTLTLGVAGVIEGACIAILAGDASQNLMFAQSSLLVADIGGAAVAVVASTFAGQWEIRARRIVCRGAGVVYRPWI